MSLELRVIDRQPGKILINYEEMREQLALELKKYQGLVFTEEQISEAKKTRANLNKVAKAIDDRRKEEKAEFMKGFETFENQTKELTNMIKNVSNEIDLQVKAFEEKEIEAKKIEIAIVWTRFGYNKITLDKIYNTKWENKTYSLKQIEEDMKAKIEEIESDLETIKALCPNDNQKALILQSKYLVHLDLKKVVNEYNEEQKASEILLQKNPTPQEVIDSCEEFDNENPPIVEEEKEVIYELSFKVFATEMQIKALSQFLKGNGYKYEQI